MAMRERDLESAVISALRAGEEVTDRAFDRLLPSWARAPSRRHWTPVAVARRAAELLVAQAGMRVLDVGSGIGKFCFIGAMTTPGPVRGHRATRAPGARRPGGGRRASASAAAASCTGTWRTSTSGPGTASTCSTRSWNTCATNRPSIAPSNAGPSLYRRYIRLVEQQLDNARTGARLCTYWGFGGDLPPGWELETGEEVGTGRLELWIKS